MQLLSCPNGFDRQVVRSLYIADVPVQANVTFGGPARHVNARGGNGPITTSVVVRGPVS